MIAHQRRRVFYVAPLAVDPRYRHLESPAARNKVLGVTSALRAAKMFPVVVTSTGTGNTSLRHPLHITRQKGTCLVEVYSIGGGLGRRLSSLFFLVWFALKIVRRDDQVLLYNSYPDLLLLAAWQRLRGRPCILDLEDAPRADDLGSLGRLINLVYPLFRRLCARPMMVASVKLAEQMGIGAFLPVYGVSSFFPATSPASFSGPAVRVTFGGTILRDTGAELFVTALRDLASRPLATPIEIFVTGKFEKGLFDSLQHDLEGHRWITLYIIQDLDTDSYARLISTMDVGLCLKLSSSDTGQTTFPSKVIEIAAIGMLLISTRVSDVPLIFDHDHAVLLNGENPAELADALADITADRAKARARAARGQARVKQYFSAQRVGNDLASFLDHASTSS